MERKIDYGRYNIPPHMWESVDRYLQYGVAGDFLTALMSNDLMRTYEKADHINQHHIRDYCVMLYNEFPLGSYGSKENVKRWQEAKMPKVSTTTPSDEAAPEHQEGHPNG